MAPGDGFEVDLAGPTALDVGQPGRYTVDVTNHDVPATNLVLFVSTDGGFSSAQFAIVDDGDWTCEGTAFVQCLLPALASDTAAPTITLDMTPSEGATDPMTLFANLDVGQDSFGDDVTVDISAAVDLEIVGTRPTVVNGQPYTVPFVVSEVGSSDAPAAGPIEVLIDPFFFNGVSVTDGGVTVAGSGWSCAAFDCTHPGPVPAGGSLPALVASGTFTVEGSIQGSLLNGDDLFANNDVGVPIRPIDPDMVVIQGSPFQPKRGQAITYVAGAQNGGDSPITSAFTLSLTSSLDAPTATGTGWTCTAFSGGAATCTYPSTTLGQFQSLPLVTVGGTVPANATTLTGSATISPTGFRTNNDTRSFNVAVVIPPSDLAIDLTTTVTKVSPGGPFEATATVSNVGAGVATGTVTMSFSGPLTSLTASGSGWTCTATNCTHPGPVPAGGSLPVITLTGTVLTNLVSGALSVFVSPGGPGGNDSDFVSLPLVRPDMTASLGSTTPTFDEGGQGTFTATITNV
ncbi:MAG TPA: hypothetical protein VGK49_03460, partial [Ilumatobacteraceae bacterium]